MTASKPPDSTASNKHDGIDGARAEKLGAVFSGVPFGVETGDPARLTGIVHPAGSELTVSRATRSEINAFGIQYEGNSAFSTSRFSWAA